MIFFPTIIWSFVHIDEPIEIKNGTTSSGYINLYENSTNGIFVNGELTKESKLSPGTRIQIGKYFLIVSSVDKT